MLIRALALVLTILAGATSAQASSTFWNLPLATLPLSGAPTAVPMDQGAGCPYNAQPCTTVQAPATAFMAAAPNVVINATGTACTPVVPTLNVPANGVYISCNGSRVPYCLAEAVPFGCQSPFAADFTAQISATMTTWGPAEIQENSLNIVVYDTSGSVNWWVASTAWPANARVLGSGANVYVQGPSACVSGTVDPSGSGGSDGSCFWTLAGGSDQAAKQGIGVSILAGPNGGDAWAIAAETDFQAGFTGNGGFGMEIDTRNASSVDPYPGNPGQHTMDGIYMGSVAGTYPITTSIEVAPQQNPSGPVFAAYNGIRLLGINSFKSFALLFETTGGLIGIGNEPLLSAPNFTLAFVSDSGIQPIAWDEAGTCTIACFYFNANTPADMQFNGTHEVVGLYATGTFSGSFISSVGTKTTGWDEAGTCSVSCFYIRPTSAPSAIQLDGSGMNVGLSTTATFVTAVWSDTAMAGTSLITAAGHYPTSLIYAMNATTPAIIEATNFTLSNNGQITIPTPPTGTPAGSACFTAGGILVIKTTPGSCI